MLYLIILAPIATALFILVGAPARLTALIGSLLVLALTILAFAIFDPASGWTQINAKGEGGPRIPPGSRRQRRKLIRPAWRNSLR